MFYVALLRGINVGGKGKVGMTDLRALFEGLGFGNVKTYINSGNVIFETSNPEAGLVKTIETAIEKHFGFAVRVIVRDQASIEKLVRAIPKTWVNDKAMRCDVMILWKEIDNPKILEQLPFNPYLEDLKYFPGAVVWRISRANVTKTRMTKILGTDLYKQITIRNVNTVRKLHELMQNL